MRFRAIYMNTNIAALCVPPPAGVTWNPSDNGGLTLSNGNLTATGTGSVQAVRGTQSISGKKYFEGTLTGATDVRIGFGNASHSLSVAAGGTGNQSAAVLSDRSVRYQGGGIVYNLSTVSGTRIFGIAMDTSVTKAWFRIMDGTAHTWDGFWNGATDSSENPATGAGGFDYSILVAFGGAGAPYFPMCSVQNNGGDICVANFGPTFEQAAPSGFSAL